MVRRQTDRLRPVAIASSLNLLSADLRDVYFPTYSNGLRIMLVSGFEWSDPTADVTNPLLGGFVGQSHDPKFGKIDYLQ